MADDLVRLALSREAALLLHEWMARAVDEENGAGLKDGLQDDGEIWALHALYVLLEQTLTEPFEAGFEKKLQNAAQNLVALNGPWAWDKD